MGVWETNLLSTPYQSCQKAQRKPLRKDRKMWGVAIAKTAGTLQNEGKTAF